MGNVIIGAAHQRYLAAHLAPPASIFYGYYYSREKCRNKDKSPCLLNGQGEK